MRFRIAYAQGIHKIAKFFDEHIDRRVAGPQTLIRFVQARYARRFDCLKPPIHFRAQARDLCRDRVRVGFVVFRIRGELRPIRRAVRVQYDHLAPCTDRLQDHDQADTRSLARASRAQNPRVYADMRDKGCVFAVFSLTHDPPIRPRHFQGFAPVFDLVGKGRGLRVYNLRGRGGGFHADPLDRPCMARGVIQGPYNARSQAPRPTLRTMPIHAGRVARKGRAYRVALLYRQPDGCSHIPGNRRIVNFLDPIDGVKSRRGTDRKVRIP